MAMATAAAGTAMQGISNDLSLGFGLWGNEANYRQEKANLKAQQEAHEYNARMLDREAEHIEKQSNAEDEHTRYNQGVERSAARAAYGSSGVALSGGSPLAALADFAATQEMESLEARRANRVEAQSYEHKAIMERYQARLVKTQMKAASTNHALGVAGSWTSWVGNAGKIMSGSASSMNSIAKG